MSEKLDRRKKYTRKVLKESFVQLLSEKPIKTITVKEICDMADINRSTFYTHFSDQYDLLNKMEEEIVEDLNTYLSGYRFDIEEESLKMTQKLIEYIRENKLVFQTLLINNGDPTFEKRLMEVAQGFLMNNWHEINRNLNNKESMYLSRFVISGAINVIKAWLENEMDQSPKDMAKLINNFINEGLGYLD